METLFGFLATRFAVSTENIAIEALGYILSRSRAARVGLASHLGVSGIRIGDDVRFVTQSTGEDAARPDIEGITDDGQKSCVIECKFWAGLTANQPATYVARLSDLHPGVLAFIVPSMRLNALWEELRARLAIAGIPVGERAIHGGETYHAQLADRHGFVLTSWRGVLSAIVHAMETGHDSNGIDDAKQLIGLCKRMDMDAFIPFRSEEITSPEIPRRFLQLTQLASDVCDLLISTQKCFNQAVDGTRLTAASSRSFSGRYMRASGTVFMLCFDCEAWSRHMLSPLWFKVDVIRYPYARRAFQRYCDQEGLENSVIDAGRELAVPLKIIPNIEADVLRENLSRQVLSICAILEAGEPQTETDELGQE